MKNVDESIRLKHVTALRLLGVSNEQMVHLTKESIATVRRSNERLCKKLKLNNKQQLREALHTSKQRVKGTEFTKKDTLEGVAKALERTLSTDIRRYITLVWFGNVHTKPCDYGQLSEYKLEHRFINPKSPRWGQTGAQRQANRLKNLELSLNLMGWAQEEIDEFRLQIATPLLDQQTVSQPTEDQGKNSKRPPNHQLLLPEPHYDYNYDLMTIPPRLPVKRKQKDKKRLIQFAIKHLARCQGNFIYAERFTRTSVTPDEVKIEEVEEDIRHTWWVFGPHDILDWFECHEI